MPVASTLYILATPTTSSEGIVYVLGPHYVILGKGLYSQTNAGNIECGNFLEAFEEHYHNASKTEKMILVDQTMPIVLNSGPEFAF
jgi:hypothetical protein